MRQRNTSEYNKNYYEKNKQEILRKKKLRVRKEYNRSYLARKAENLKKRYGITLDDYNKMFDSQQGKCAICFTHQTELKVALAVDHRHSDGKVRELLCDGCNRGIGLLREDPVILQSAIRYLEKHK